MYAHTYAHTHIRTHTHTHEYAYNAEIAGIQIPFHSPVAYRDPESCDMINLLIRLLIDALNEYAYNAEIAMDLW